MKSAKAICCAAVLLLAAVCSAQTERPPVVAGSFYPADSGSLARLVEQHLEADPGANPVDGRIVALIVPHAGLVYSGHVAASAYRLLEGSDVDKVVLCGPSHRYGLTGNSVYGPGVTWRTPLGRVKCQEELCRELLEQEGMKVVPEAHREEHSLEVQLPYLQTVLGDFEIVPIAAGNRGRDDARLLSEALAALELDERTVLVASTDWQHYRSAEAGWPMDSLGMDCITNLDVARLERELASGKVEACGGGVTLAVMRAAMAHGADRAKIVKYGHSGSINGDNSRVVGYVAAVLYEDTSSSDSQPESSAAPETMETQPTYTLSATEKQTLLGLARGSIEAHLEGASPPSVELTDKLRQPGAAFVTLEKNGDLRGCIGHVVAMEPLHETVAHCAVQAASADLRFPPVTEDEMREIEIEISVLTPLQEMAQLSEIEIGRDGLMIVMGNYRGLLLPQVAVEYGWDREEFLRHTCRKAGLPDNAYRSPDATVYRFQALIFSEAELRRH